MPEPLLERLRREEKRKAGLTPEEKIEEYFDFRRKVLWMEHFGYEELDPIALSKKEPDVLNELQDHVVWEVTDNLNDTINRAESSIAAHNMLVFGAKLLIDEDMEVPARLQEYLDNEPNPRRRGRGRPPQAEADRDHYLDLILYTCETLSVYATRNAATSGVVSACDHIEVIAKNRGLILGYSYSNLSRIWEERKRSL